MHVRFSTVVGLPVVEEGSEEEIAALSGILLHPDQGKVEGFYVRVPGFLRSDELFLSVMDIVHWGNRVRVRDHQALSGLGDLVRLQALAEENRPVLGQVIQTEDGRVLGKCRDVQFDTKTFYVEWIFPRTMWRWGVPLPTSSIVIVRPDAIVVRDNVTIPEAVTGPSMLQTLDPLGTSTAQNAIQRRKDK